MSTNTSICNKNILQRNNRPYLQTGGFVFSAYTVEVGKLRCMRTVVLLAECACYIIGRGAIACLQVLLISHDLSVL